MNTHATDFAFHSNPLHTFQIERAQHCAIKGAQKLSLVGDPTMGEALFHWMHDCQEDLFLTTSLFKKGLGTCNISFGLQVESEPMDDSIWTEDVNLFLDVHAKDQFWSLDLKPPTEWKYLTVLSMRSTSAREGSRKDNPINDLVQTLNMSNQSILLQNVYKIAWYQPTDAPPSDHMFFPPDMLDGYVPKTRPAPARKIHHALLVYSNQPLGSFVKTSIQQTVLGPIPGKPNWKKVHAQQGSFSRMTPQEVFTDRQCVQASLRITTMELHAMLTANLLYKEERGHHFFGPM